MNEDVCGSVYFSKEKKCYIYEKKEKKKCDHITFLTQRIKRHESRKERNSNNVI